MLFARDKERVEFALNGVAYVAYLTGNMKSVCCFANSSKIPHRKRVPMLEEADRWFIDHQAEFDLEGYS